MTVLLRIAYDGTDFHGSARQAGRDGRALRTVQGTLEAALAGVYQREVRTAFASRTDAGVHACGNLASFDPPFPVPTEGLLRGLVGALPLDVTVTAAWEESAPVDVRGSNRGKHYRYRLRCNPAPDPLSARTCWHVGRELNVAAMEEASRALVGTFDFSAFRAADCQARTTERTVRAVEITPRGGRFGVDDRGRLDEPSPRWSTRHPDELVVDVRGTAFLKNMVRIMVGHLVDVGAGRRSVASVAEARASRDRTQAGVTAPARGLCLMEVHW